MPHTAQQFGHLIFFRIAVPPHNSNDPQAQ
jgi:hypothetical protein